MCAGVVMAELDVCGVRGGAETVGGDTRKLGCCAEAVGARGARICDGGVECLRGEGRRGGGGRLRSEAGGARRRWAVTLETWDIARRRWAVTLGSGGRGGGGCCVWGIKEVNI